MRTIAAVCLVALSGAAQLSRVLPQDPPKPAEPRPVAPRAADAHPFEGVYELRRRVRDGREDALPSRGHLAITRRHMFLCLVGPGTSPDMPLLRAGVRGWRQQDEQIRTEIKLGYFTDEDGGVHLEKPGTVELRRIVQARGTLRLHQDDRSYLEFERVE